MANQLFNELVKLAAMKAAFDPGAWGGGGAHGRRFRGGSAAYGGGGNMYVGRGGYMGPIPALVPGMRERQGVETEGRRQQLPETQWGRAQVQRAQDQGTRERKDTTEYDQMVQARLDLARLKTEHALSEKEHRDLSEKLEAAKSDVGATREILRGTAGGESRLRGNAAPRGNWAQNLVDSVDNTTTKWFGAGKAEDVAYRNAQAKYDALAASHQQSAASLAKMTQRREAEMNQHQGILDTNRMALGEMSAHSRGDISHRAGLQSVPGRPGSGAMPESGVSAAKVPGIAHTPLDVAGTAPPVTHKPGGGLQHPPTIPIGGGPAGAPNRIPPPPAAPAPLMPQGSAMFLPTTLDQLVEGAARTMFDHYVKVAQAKLAVELATAKTVGKKWGTPETLAKREPQVQSKPPALTTAKYLTTKDPEEFRRRLNQGLTKKGNSMMGLDSSVVSRLLGKGRSRLSDSSVNLGPTVAGVGSAIPTPRSQSTGADTLDYSAAQKAERALKSHQATADQTAKDQMNVLRQAHKIHHEGIQAEQKEFTAKHGPPAGAGSQSFRSTVSVPGGYMG